MILIGYGIRKRISADSQTRSLQKPKYKTMTTREAATIWFDSLPYIKQFLLAKKYNYTGSENVWMQEVVLPHYSGFVKFDQQDHQTLGELYLKEHEVEDYGHNMKDHIYSEFINGASWQKEQDKALIQSLLDAFILVVNKNMFNPDFEGCETAQSAITKANEYLNK